MASGPSTGYPQQDQGHDQGNQQQVGPLKLTDEEKKVLKECEDESFYNRAFPLFCGAFLGAQYLVRSGKLARHPTLGAFPKSIIAGSMAYLFGKVSYLRQCRLKILEKIPDSNLAMSIKKGGSNTLPDMSNRQEDVYLNQTPDGNREDYNSPRSKYSSDTPSFGGLSDSQRPSLDNEVKVKKAPEEKTIITYGDLRQKNRQEYQDNLSKPAPPKQPDSPSYKDSPFMPQKTWPDKGTPPNQEPPAIGDSSRTPPKKKRTNMWGDEIED